MYDVFKKLGKEANVAYFKVHVLSQYSPSSTKGNHESPQIGFLRPDVIYTSYSRSDQLFRQAGHAERYVVRVPENSNILP
jgi:hypothetical protein